MSYQNFVRMSRAIQQGHKATPTPTPWKVATYLKGKGPEFPGIYSEQGGSVVIPRVGPDSQGYDDTANAAYIVKCVNSHAALVEALNDLVLEAEEAYWHDGGEGDREAIDNAKAALAAAEES